MNTVYFKNLFLILLIGIGFLSINTQANNTQSSSHKQLNESSSEILPDYDTKAVTDTLNMDSLILEAKETIRLYKESEKRRRDADKKEVSLLKTEIELSKEQSVLTRKIITKLKNKVKDTNKKELIVQMDSTCIEQYSRIGRLFKSEKCKAYDYNYFIVLGEKRYNLNKE